MTNEVDRHNESAASYAWLKKKLGFMADGSPGMVTRSWEEVREQMLSRRQLFGYQQDWISDFWLVRSSENAFGWALSPTWDPPAKVDDWPALGVQALVDKNSLQPYRSRYEPLQQLLEQAMPPAPANNKWAVDRFMTMKTEIAGHGDSKMRQVEHVRAWLGTSIGHLLMGIVLTPDSEPVDLVSVTIARLSIPRDALIPASWTNDFEERRLEILYNLRPSTTDKSAFADAGVRIGQGEEWRQHWDWLSLELPKREMTEAVQLAAGLLCCPPLIDGLINALQSGDDYLKHMALAVIRRCLLSLRVMSWLEDALAQTWDFARPEDLACFAFNAVKPDWPHRVAGISHRSADVKPALMQTRLWTSGRCAIDSNYVPSWETNIGMMWGLFAATPAIVYVDSPNYAKSIWCLREYEILYYLIEKGDFLSERWIFFLTVAELDTFDQMFTALIDNDDLKPESKRAANTFPPLCNVWAPTAMAEWEVRVFQASAALRIMHLDIANPAFTNEVGWLIKEGLVPPQPTPTNNIGGWLEYAAVFKNLSSLCKSVTNKLDIRLPEDYFPEETTLDFELSRRIPDLASGLVSLGDILVAYEWFRIEWPLMVNEKYGDFIVINCRGFTQDQWLNDIRLSLMRGIAAIRTPRPVWFLQKAGQNIESWPLVGQRPIFTEHHPNQFSWMFEMSLDRAIMQSRYPEDSGLQLSDELITICKNGI